MNNKNQWVWREVQTITNNRIKWCSLNKGEALYSKDISHALLYMNDIYWIGWLRIPHFFGFQCNVALSRMWIDGAIKIICLKSAKLLSFAVNSDHSSNTDPNLKASVQYRGCKVYLIYRRRPSVSLCQFERCNVAWDGVSVMKSLNRLFCCFESKINSFCWHFVTKFFQ